MRVLCRYRWIGLFFGGCLLQMPGCISALQREIEALAAPGAIGNGLLLRDSFLFDIFGPGVLVFVRDFIL